MNNQIALNIKTKLAEVSALCPYCQSNLFTDRHDIFCTNCHHVITTDNCSCYDCSKKRNVIQNTEDYFKHVVPVTISEDQRALVLLLLELLPNENDSYKFNSLFEQPLLFNNRIVTEKCVLEPLIQHSIFVPQSPYNGVELYKDEFIKINYQEAEFQLNVRNLSDNKFFDIQTKQHINLLFETDILISSFTRHFDNLSIPYSPETLLTKLQESLLLYRPYLHWDDFTSSVSSTIGELERLIVRCQLDRTQAVNIGLMDFNRVLEFVKKRKTYPINTPTKTKHFVTSKGIEVWCEQFLTMTIEDFFNRIPTKYFS